MHTADLHLGHRRFSAITSHGLNQREVDIAIQFSRMVSKWIELTPDLVVIAGDVFDKSHPTNLAVTHFANQLQRFKNACPGALVFMCEGNHDRPSRTEIGSIFPLYQKHLGVASAWGSAAAFAFPERSLSVLLVPDGAHRAHALEPDPACRFNVMVLHGGLVEVQPWLGLGSRNSQLSAAQLNAERWSYVALGDYHARRDFAPNCGYSGAPELCSSDIWGELKEGPKGFIEFDLETHTRTFHELAPVRPVFDLEPIDAQILTSAELSARIQAQADAIAIDNAIVRQVVTNCTADQSRAIDQRIVRKLCGRALHYHFDPRRPLPRHAQPVEFELTDRLVASLNAGAAGGFFARHASGDVHWHSDETTCDGSGALECRCNGAEGCTCGNAGAEECQGCEHCSGVKPSGELESLESIAARLGIPYPNAAPSPTT